MPHAPFLIIRIVLYSLGNLNCYFWLMLHYDFALHLTGSIYTYLSAVPGFEGLS
jgi:hypothetical protein